MTSRQKRQSEFINSWKAAKRELTRVSSLSSCLDFEQNENNSITDVSANTTVEIHLQGGITDVCNTESATSLTAPLCGDDSVVCITGPVPDPGLRE